MLPANASGMITMIKQTLLFTFIFAVAVVISFGQKAEPKRFELAKAGGSVVLSERLSNAQEMEYVFSASKGQTIILKMANPNLFDYRVFSEEFGLETEFDSSPSLELELPGTGDYLLFVRKKMTAKRRTASFRLTVTTKAEN